MGEVYRATDVRLKRDVAIKVLPDAFAQDADRLARFEREARTLAALNHPNIAALYGLEQIDGGRALVMELIDGPTLAELLAQGPIPIDEALTMARQIADALDVAHEQGIIHRDLKPANVKVRHDGTVKVLDFGLAKAMESSATSGDVEDSPTMTSPRLTAYGVILGTAAYMSPEQARGRPVDKRTDVWAFGCVLYEMLTGRRAFEGDNAPDVLANVIKSEPAWDALPANLSRVLGSYLRRCLEKDPRQRVRDIGDVGLALKGAFDSGAVLSNGAYARSKTSRRQALQVLLASTGAALVAGAMTWSLWPKPQSGVVSRFRDQIPEGGQLFGRDARNIFAVSPDGRAIVYSTPQGLHLRSLGELEARIIRGTERRNPYGPFFSADGRSVGFYSSGTDQLMRIAVEGGVAVPVSRAAAPLGASWADDDTIFVGQPEGIVRVPAGGGTPTRVVRARAGERLHTPQLLPNGKVLFTVMREGVSEVAIQSLTDDARHVVLREGANASYLPTGHLAYTIGSDLWGATYDLDRAAVGTARLLERNLLIPRAGWAYGTSDNGTLVFRPGGGLATPVLVDRNGVTVRSLSADGPLERPRHPALDPNGERLALIVGPPGESRVWIYYLNGRPAESRTFPGNVETLVWSPEGDRLAVGYAVGGRRGVYLVPLSGDPGPPERLFASPENVFPQAWSKDEILIMRVQPGRKSDLLAVSVEDPSKTRPVASNPTFNEYYGRLSPNGQWLAYGSLQEPSGIYVRKYSDPTDRGQRVSAVSGNLPLWSRDGKELYYVNQDGQLLALRVDTTGPDFSADKPTSLFGPPYDFSMVASSDETNTHVYYDVAPAGRFVVMRPEGTGRLETIVVQNWFEELRQRAPVE
jgi:serine/threonine-protein kinase